VTIALGARRPHSGGTGNYGAPPVGMPNGRPYARDVRRRPHHHHYRRYYYHQAPPANGGRRRRLRAAADAVCSHRRRRRPGRADCGAPTVVGPEVACARPADRSRPSPTRADGGSGRGYSAGATDKPTARAVPGI